VLELLQSWMADAEGIVGRVPDLVAATGSWSWAVGIVAALGGVGLLLAGARLGPVLTGIGGALVGWLAGVHVATLAELKAVPIPTIGWAVAASLGLLSVFLPAAYPALLGAVAGALLGLRAPLGGSAWIGAAAGALLLGCLALLLRRVVVAGTAAVAGAVLLVAGVVALSLSTPALSGVTHRPVLLTGFGALLAVAGTAFQAATQGGGGPRLRSQPRRSPRHG
jgi:hypothetical protein